MAFAVDQECCILLRVRNVASPTVKTQFWTILSLAVPLYSCESLRQLLPRARSMSLPAPREAQPHSVSFFAVALVNLKVFPFQVSLAQACAWVTVHSWGHGTALSICLFKWWIRGGCGEKKPTKKRCSGRTVSLKGILKSLNTENIIPKEPDWLYLKLISLGYSCWFWWDMTHNFLIFCISDAISSLS